MGRLTDGSPLYVTMAEEWLVGAAFSADAEDIHEVSRFVSPKDFRDHTLGVIWNAVTKVNGDPTIPRVAEYLLSDKWLDRVGAEPRLVELSAAVSPWLAAQTRGGMVAHAKIVREWAQKRSVVSQAIKTANDALSGKRTFRGGVQLP